MRLGQRYCVGYTVSMTRLTKNQLFIGSLAVSVAAFTVTEGNRTTLFAWKSFGASRSGIADIALSPRGNFVAATNNKYRIAVNAKTQQVWRVPMR